MFTGIVQDIGEIESLEPRAGDFVIGIDRTPSIRRS